MRLYVIGTQGQVARSLHDAMIGHPDIVAGFGSRPGVDLLDPASLVRAIDEFGPDIVINPAAYTAVDKAEDEPDLAFAINRDGAQAVASAAKQSGASIIHLSTDYVFDGRKEVPYLETDDPNPQGVYGKSKLAGELAVMHSNPRHIVLRTSWVYAPFGNNFVRTMLRLAGELDQIRVVNDQKGCPTYAPDIAVSIISLARKLISWRPEYAGVTHLVGPNSMTWCEFAREIVSQSARKGGPSSCVDAIATSEYPTRASRPANSELSTRRLRLLFDIELPKMDTSLSNCIDRILATRGTP